MCKDNYCFVTNPRTKAMVSPRGDLKYNEGDALDLNMQQELLGQAREPRLTGAAWFDSGVRGGFDEALGGKQMHWTRGRR